MKVNLDSPAHQFFAQTRGIMHVRLFKVRFTIKRIFFIYIIICIIGVKIELINIYSLQRILVSGDFKGI